MKKWLQLSFTLLIAISLMVACSSQEETENADNLDQAESQNEAGAEQEESAEEEAPFPVTVTDALDNEIMIEAKPERIVSLIPSNTEIAFALGMGEEVVGVTEFDNYPEEALEKEKIGGIEINLEKIISLQPDLVLAHESTAVSSKESLDQLKEAGLTVLFVNDATSFEDVYRSIELIGEATGTSDKAAEIVTSMKEEIEKVKDIAASIPETDRKKVFIEVGAEPEIYTTGTNTFMHEMLEVISAVNIAGDLEGWQPITEEAIVEKNPDVIITTYGYYTPNAAEQVLAREGWSQVTAIQSKQVIDVHSDLVARSGPRLIEGVKELAKAVYPDVFKDI
ncbi:iron complex transport system substrate-binding protein [Bacillus oleivorans]|uniref:Iron complex transport system substrate-binding protein n=1 Tax=Bacillus oleivorans TaxID=1448271 RepID=A0A285D2J2_9BACI|nr:ABC transporter substrate-binding protein [Bacillus oleivorans]SNX73992.1 iron complex transport system substrate-binding protein [Bacillus oleivorans]